MQGLVQISLKSLKDKTTLVISDAEKLMTNNVKVLKSLTKGGNYGLYISVNHPYNSLVKILASNGIITDKMFFIDCITQMAGGSSERLKNCLFLRSPSSLTELGIAMSQALEILPKGKRYLFMDALSTLVIYNSPGTLTKFAHFIISKMKIMEVTGVFMVVRKEIDEQTMTRISQFADEVVRT